MPPELKRLRDDPAFAAQQAGLRYVSDEEPGYRRQRRGRGFTYFRPDGERVTDADLRSYFGSLAIPPAWTEVWICSQRNGHIQATGRDEKGRKQYRYHPAWEAARNRHKFDRMAAFGHALPKLRAQVNEDLRRRKLSYEKVVAVAVALLDETMIRIGNAEYAARNGSHGLTTLRDEHLEVEGGTLRLRYRAKGGKLREITLRDRRLAGFMLRCQEVPGQELFQYVCEDDTCRPIESTDVNAYLQATMGEAFTAKDFRTWGGTVTAAALLHEAGAVPTDAEAEAIYRDVVKGVADSLGNTPAVCRDYYIHPDIFAAYQSGKLFSTWQRAARSFTQDPLGLDLAETAVVRLLKQGLRQARRSKAA